MRAGVGDELVQFGAQHLSVERGDQSFDVGGDAVGAYRVAGDAVTGGDPAHRPTRTHPGSTVPTRALDN
jgi:hypothetical protein